MPSTVKAAYRSVVHPARSDTERGSDRSINSRASAGLTVGAAWRGRSPAHPDNNAVNPSSAHKTPSRHRLPSRDCRVTEYFSNASEGTSVAADTSVFGNLEDVIVEFTIGRTCSSMA